MEVKKIIHLDIDYFFAQVEELLNPQLAVHPIAIGSYNGRSVLCTSNYIARKYGVKSAMPTFLAQKLCPSLIIINPKMDIYRSYSEQVFSILYRYTDKIQIVSVDEAYIDVTDCPLFCNSATLIAQNMKKTIKHELGLTCSAGVSYNKLFAKIGSEFNKPDGIKVFAPEHIENYLGEFKLSLIPGVGKELSKILANKSYILFKDITHVPLFTLQGLYGKMGTRLYYFVRGIDKREVDCHQVRKSLSVERTFSTDINDEKNFLFYLQEIFEKFEERLSKYPNRTIRKIFIKIKDFEFKSNSLEEISFTYSFAGFKRLFDQLKSENPKALRLIGLGVRFHDPLSEDHERQLELPIEFDLQIA